MSDRKNLTVSKLIKLLQKIEADGYGRSQVVVDTSTLWDGNGTFNICDIAAASVTEVFQADGDGFRVENKDGSHRSSWKVALQGVYADE